MADNTSIEWTDRVPLRVRVTAARRVGVTLDEYAGRIAAGEKWCHAHKEWHPRSEFGRDRSRSDGLDARCLNARLVAKGRPGQHERRDRAALGQSWCRRCMAWLLTSEVRAGVCRVHAAEEARGHYAQNRESYRARKNAYGRGLAIIPPWFRCDRFEDFGGLCGYGCGMGAHALDHIWPVAKGGESVPGNLVPACTSCNSSKKDRDPFPWVDRGFDAFPDAWERLVSLAIQHNTDDWVEGMNDV